MTRKHFFLSILLFLVVLFLMELVTLIMIWKVGYAPDEQSHLVVAKNFCDSFLPHGRDLWLYGISRAHAYNLFSPVPYSLHAFSGLLCFDEVCISANRPAMCPYRLAGVIYCFLQFVVFVLIARELGCHRLAAVLVASALAAWPQVVVLHSYINADSYTILISSVVVLISLRLIRYKRSSRLKYKDWLIIGLIMSALFHAKDTAYPVFAVLLLALFERLWARIASGRDTNGWLKPQEWRLSIRVLLSMTVVILWLAGSYRFAVFRELGNGGFFAGSTHLALMRSSFQGKGVFNYYGDRIDYFKGSSKQDFWQSWSDFRFFADYAWRTTWGDINKVGGLNQWMLNLIGILFVVALWGWGLGLYSAFNKHWKKYRVFSRRIGIFLTVSNIICIPGVILPLIFHNVTPQGRLILPLLSSVGPILIFGISFFFRVAGLTRQYSVCSAALIWLVVFVCGNFMLCRLLF